MKLLVGDARGVAQNHEGDCLEHTRRLELRKDDAPIERREAPTKLSALATLRHERLERIGTRQRRGGGVHAATRAHTEHKVAM